MRDILTANIILTLSVFAWAMAQILKVVVIFIQYRKIEWNMILSGGGMPSSHSAFVCACATSTGMTCGFSSPMFALAAAFAFIVMYDAANVRHAAGEQAKILNYIMDSWSELRPEFFVENLKELLGHTPLQVFFGALLGILIGVGGYYLIF